jgi:hypothetical protein
MSEELDLLNVIEIQKIRSMLIHHPDLLSMFELLIIVCNKRLNDEKPVIKIPIEPNIEPDLSSDSEDDVFFSEGS